MNRKIYTLIIAIVSFILPVSLTAQQTVEIDAMKDNTLYEHVNGDLSNGAGSYLFSGKTNQGKIRRALLAFDIAANVPPGASIQEVYLDLNVSKTGAPDKTMNIHRVLADWGEGTSDASGNEGSGTTPTPQDATWIHTFFDTQNWSMAGGEYEMTPSASATIGGIGSYTWGSTTEMTQDVEFWLNNASQNFGWIIIGDESGNKTTKRFDSRENSSTANRPKLRVTFIPPSGIGDFSEQSQGVRFDAIYPNPVSESANISFDLSEEKNVMIQIVNLQGQIIETIVDETMDTGEHLMNWNAANINSGMYYVILKSGENILTQKLIKK